MKKLATVATAPTVRAVAGIVLLAALTSAGHAAGPHSPPGPRAAQGAPGPQALVANPMADIADLFAWNEGSNLNLIMDVAPLDNGTYAFDPTVVYVFHVTSKPGRGLGVSSGVETRVICRFASSTSVECWATGAAGTKDYLIGDPSNPAGVVSPRGKLRVFAGRRSDPTFADQAGFNTAVGRIKAIPATPPPDGARCPTGIEQGAAQQIRLALGGGVDSFATANVMAIVVQIDKSLVVVEPDTIVAVWASTHAGS